MRWRPTGSLGAQSPALYDQCHARSGTTASTRASRCAKPLPLPTAAELVEVVGGKIFLPSACLFLQKGGNGSRTSGQHSCRPWKTKPFPESSCCFVASTEPPALLEKRNHLARAGVIIGELFVAMRDAALVQQAAHLECPRSSYTNLRSSVLGACHHCGDITARSWRAPVILVGTGEVEVEIVKTRAVHHAVFCYWEVGRIESVMRAFLAEPFSAEIHSHAEMKHRIVHAEIGGDPLG